MADHERTLDDIVLGPVHEVTPSGPLEHYCLDCRRPLPRYVHLPKRCAACAHAHHRSAMLTRPMLRRGRLAIPVDCWCQRTSVWVRWADFQQGLTGSCGHHECRRAA